MGERVEIDEMWWNCSYGMRLVGMMLDESIPRLSVPLRIIRGWQQRMMEF